ncbi:probable RNA-dependent RNA polymerase 1 isoform X2 [Corylus avellana]|uniref:probable RNA-dependent RNA polymerase 1 isoform X2 n=1 Tax=Corylus avellana TaxID=13451 RepID=UPI001E20AA38|nr:probable RNA-dependent RNA polymerase 1 isoform X2 [Corylus avellana]
MDIKALHFGYQISKETFSVLWKQEEDVSVGFDLEKRKWFFFLSHLSEAYKLEISYDSIWQIKLHRPRGQSTIFLLLQLLGAPKIHKKDVSCARGGYQWFREVDFTPLCGIGQSSALCLELPLEGQLPKFLLYEENEGQFVLQEGSNFSCNSGLVPIVNPPPSFNLPYKILFKINSLVQNGCLPGPAIDINFCRLVDPTRIKLEYIESALDKLYHLKDCCYEPVRWLSEQYKRYATDGRLPTPPAISLDDGLVYVHRVQITPSKVYFRGPEVSLSNRILRNYPEDIDNFLRVSFVDEDLDKLHATVLSPRASSANEDDKRTSIYERILSTLRNGIVIGDKKFEFLAFSNSQLRENSLWMFASRTGLTAAGIREWMGDFREIRIVAKYAARLGQSFSSSRKTLHVGRHEIEMIPDVEAKRSGITYCFFSDGIGKISAELAREVASKCGCRNSVPSAFQIRYGGFKGVVAVDPTSSIKLSLRKSMCKYNSQNTTLDVLTWSKYQPCFLNHQIITLLSYLGVKDKVFIKKQRETIDQLNAILTDSLIAREALEFMFPGEIPTILKEMLAAGYKPNEEPFLFMMLQVLRASTLMDLRDKSRIYVPNGRSMMGCLDETGILEYGQIFAQISRFSKQLGSNSSLKFSPSSSDPNNFIFEGKVVVAKNPCLYPGDVRVLRAVNVPALQHMVDCVVFPQKGPRPHPNECSGSDLDGDTYFVCWDPDLIPSKQIEPMDYSPAPTVPVDHDVTIEEVQEYFPKYMVNDNLGIIDNAHKVFADKERRRAMSGKCIKLAKLHSIAVDFPKSGVVVEVPYNLRPKTYPDFMEKPDKRTYKSQSVIGKLFREVIDIASCTSPINPFTREVAEQCYDSDMEVDGFEVYISDAFDYKNKYDSKLGNLMDYYGIETEAEILNGNILKMSKFFNKRKDMEAINYAVKALRKEARTWFNNGFSDTDSDTDVVNAKASAWYYVTYHYRYWGRYNEGMRRAHFLSFPWCIGDKLIQIKRKASCISALEHHFSHGLNLD